ncbi:hypothetical protein Tco_1438566 [Tanacetum coccineum]
MTTARIVFMLLAMKNISTAWSEVVHSVFNSRESDVDDSPINNRFKIGKGFHVVPPPYTGNYMPPRPDLSFAGLDESVFQSAMRKTTTSVPKTETSISKTSKEMSFNHLIKDCEFHDNKKVEKPVLNNKGRVTGQREIRAVWNNAQRVNHQNKLTYPHTKRNFVPTAVVKKKSGQIRRVFNKKLAAKTNNFNEKVNTARVNNVTTVGPKAVVSDAEGNRENAVKSSACWIWRPTCGMLLSITPKDSGFIHA